MLRSPVPCLLAAAACSLLGSCAFHSTAKRWNGHLDAAGQPMFLLTSTYWGANFGIGLPWFGNTTIDKMIEASTAQIRPEDGSNLQVIETECYNGWAAIPPLTWFVTPVMTTVSIVYRPSPQALAAAGIGAPR